MSGDCPLLLVVGERGRGSGERGPLVAAVHAVGSSDFGGSQSRLGGGYMPPCAPHTRRLRFPVNDSGLAAFQLLQQSEYISNNNGV